MSECICPPFDTMWDCPIHGDAAQPHEAAAPQKDLGESKKNQQNSGSEVAWHVVRAFIVQRIADANGEVTRSTREARGARTVYGERKEQEAAALERLLTGLDLEFSVPPPAPVMVPLETGYEPTLVPLSTEGKP